MVYYFEITEITKYLILYFDRSPWTVSLGEWHRLWISRTGKLAVMRVDNQPEVQVRTS